MRLMVLDALVENMRQLGSHETHGRLYAYLAAQMGVCEWLQELVGYHNPSCDDGPSWSGPIEGLRFCPFCGKRIRVVQNVGSYEDVPTECDGEGK